MVKLEALVNRGGAFGVPVPVADQLLVPSAFLARTCTSYVPLARPLIVVDSVMPVCPASVHAFGVPPAATLMRYRTS